MKRFAPFILLVLLSPETFSQFISKKESAAIDNLLTELSAKHKPKSYLIRNVSILTMIDSVLLRNQDVWVEHGIIQKIGKGIQNQNATVIDGTGKFLMPGLTDMHVHLFDKHPMKNTWLLLLVAHGVTSVRDMCGQPEKLQLKEKIKKSEILGPSIYQSGPIINSVKDNFGWFAVATSPEQGRELVINQKMAGYDGIKVYDGLSKEVYMAIADEAQKQKTLMDGHLPQSITLDDAIHARQNTLEHLIGYFEWKNNQVSTSAQNDYVSLTANSSLWNCPTIYNHYMNGSRKGANDMISYAETSGVLPGGLLDIWKKRANNNSKEIVEMVDRYGASNFETLKSIVQSLHQSKAKLIAGTDAGSLPFIIPGFSLHQELYIMAEMGIPVYDVLKMTTINAALALRKESEFGTVEVGKRADLLLLNTNPLTGINQLQNKSGLMIRGIWLSDANVRMVTEKVRLAFVN